MSNFQRPISNAAVSASHPGAMAGEIAALVAARSAIRIGQILVRKTAGGYDLCHVDDAGCGELTGHVRPQAAREIAMWNDAGKYRPLKTAPDLRRGWRLVVGTPGELRLALDFFYPAALGLFLAARREELRGVPLRKTLGRQTGMYRVTAKITDDQADALVGATCQSGNGCLRKILWWISAQRRLTSLPAEKLDPDAHPPDEIPLLCAEACNLLVAAARPIAKQNR